MEIKNCQTLEEVRSEVDVIDEQIIAFMAKRNAYIKQAAKFKKSVDEVKADDRVEAVIQNVRQKALAYDMNPNMLEDIYKLMINEMVETEIAEFQNAKNL